MRFFSFLLCLCLPLASFAQEIVTSDIDLFWKVYDQVIQETDSAKQVKLIKKEYLGKGSTGLDLICQARGYTAEEFVYSIRNYPTFWKSVRRNTLKASSLGNDLLEGVEKLKWIYPDLKPANIYFTIGALRTNGTILDGNLLLGAELALADTMTAYKELEADLSHLPSYFKTDPLSNVVALNIHEYIHTQQNSPGGYDLLSQALYEGVAEFIPVVALGIPSSTEAIAYGEANKDKVIQKFESEMFCPWIYNWIWNSPENEFNTRDLGYYVGYALAESFYNNASNKKDAVKRLIELDCTNQAYVESFVDGLQFFSKPLAELKEEYKARRPTVRFIEKNFKDPSSPSVTFYFSEPMDKRALNTEFGPLGKNHFPKIKDVNFNSEGTAVTYTFETLADDLNYQVVLESGYRSIDAAEPLIPYMVEFNSKE